MSSMVTMYSIELGTITHRVQSQAHYKVIAESLPEAVKAAQSAAIEDYGEDAKKWTATETSVNRVDLIVDAPALKTMRVHGQD